MHKKTLLELDENSPARDIICADIEKINARLWELKEPAKGGGYEKVNGNYDTIEIICNSENTINIKPFMIKDFKNYLYSTLIVDNDSNESKDVKHKLTNTVSIVIEEYFSEDFCLPVELDKLVKEKDFTITVTKKNKNGKVLYTMIYSKCNVNFLVTPSFGKIDSETQCWEVSFTFAERTIHEASNKETTEYATYQEENGKESIER